TRRGDGPRLSGRAQDRDEREPRGDREPRQVHESRAAHGPLHRVPGDERDHRRHHCGRPYGCRRAPHAPRTHVGASGVVLLQSHAGEARQVSLFGALRLAQVHPSLIKLAVAVSTHTDVQVVQGVRSLRDEELAIGEGRSLVRDPCNSKHVLCSTRTQAHALDLAPWPVKWSDIPRFVSLATLVLSTASNLGLQVTWGGTWPHL